MNTWATGKNSMKHHYLKKEYLYSNLNMEDITAAEYMHGKIASYDFEIKSVDEYHDLYVQNDTLLLADVFENVFNVFLKVYKLDLGHFISMPELP